MYNYILIPTRLLFLYFLFKFETSILLKTWKVSLSHRQLLNNRLFIHLTQLHPGTPSYME